MKNKIAVLFDLDGVIIDTEPQYDIFWKEIAEEYKLGIENFEQVVKGTTLPNILASYFSHLPLTEQEVIAWKNHEYECNMDMPSVPGALDFIVKLRNTGVKVGLVTSSDDRKLSVVFNRLNLKPYFDTIVSADRITEGKPHPMCYLLAAKDLAVEPENCLVFEDSFNGIKAGTAAGMKVIGLSTSNSAESLQALVWKVIPDFSGFELKELE